MMAAQFGSQIVTSDPIMVRLRLKLFSYERETIEAAITGYLEKLLRMHPTFVPADTGSARTAPALWLISQYFSFFPLVLLAS